ncbi:MAG TPA: bifunctional UDP-N-acetylglucosamine diphosphorylase/glucosamine-1-phosphate N-acetyltransferase GlmU [Actinomycetes bacterium]|nr:bifunctional UDP-N-acetylglucosamine diphosphorylase/glucosamine-1-phosphate N-acetyltransferase GlmU [Actinomycetes bacterium]
MSPDRPAAVVVLAAGEGTRMKSSIPKVLHAVGGRSLVHHAVAAAGELEPDHLVVVVGHGRDEVTSHLAEVAPKAATVVQEQQLGTGHAMQVALEALPRLDGTVVVTYGDVPLLTADVLQGLLDAHAAQDDAVTVLTAHLADPTGYGRVLRGDRDQVVGIVEQKDATEEQRAVREVNSGVYAFDAEVLRTGLARLDADNAQGELYLTDVVAHAVADGARVGALAVLDTWAVEGVNDRVQLAALHRELNRRTLERWMRAGVAVVDPATTWVDADVTLERDVVLEPNTLLRGRTTVATGAVVGPNCLLVDTEVGAGASVTNATTYGAVVGPEATVGPYTYLRPGTRLGRGAKAGGFVEIKASEVADGAKVPHLSYVGDATIGEGANIGAGTIVANYDGVRKSHTEVGRHSFVGSDSVLVAPVEIADGAYVAAGSTITGRVGPGELAVARGRQRNIAGWVARRRKGTRTAEAAEQAAQPGQQTEAPRADAGHEEGSDA